MLFDFAELAPKERYKLLTATVVPRPIALVSTRGRNGTVNAAPFSFFNVFSEDPAILMLGLEAARDGGLKHTTQNILDGGDFVVNLVDEALAEAMVACAAPFPADESEFDAAGLTPLASSKVTSPRISEAPVSLECVTFQVTEVKNRRHLVMGEIVALHARDGLVDPQNLHLDWAQYQPVGRLFANGYIRTHDRFDMAIPALPANPASQT